MSRNILYTYANLEEFNLLYSRLEENGREIIPFKFQETQKLVEEETGNTIDISALVELIAANPSNTFPAINNLVKLDDTNQIIVRKDLGEKALQQFSLIFCSISPLFENSEEVLSVSSFTVSHRITDCTLDEIGGLEDFLNHNLIGHSYFKQRLFVAMRNFVKLNRIKEKKILSIFLLGPSGLGKTEVARLIAEYLGTNSHLAKINFGNYSSHDALNSLIGSPAGYVGCESGELGIKLKNSQAGILVCDEFEKTTRPVFNFFLELLEDGRFTDSMAQEYDLDGYIIVFTSNLLNQAAFYKTIPPELQSRIDLICEFKPLTPLEKREYVQFQLNQYMERLKDEFSKYPVTDEVKEKLASVNYRDTDNLRDIKRMVENNVIEFLQV